MLSRLVMAFMVDNLDPKHADALNVKAGLPDMRSKHMEPMTVSARLPCKPLMAPLYAAVTGGAADDCDYVIQVP
jgi:hypothetical protein